MHRSILAVALVFLPAVPTFAQSPATPPGDANLPAPGTRGNADNVPYIGKSDPKGNPVRLAKATGHVSNYTEDEGPAVHAARPAGDVERRARHQRRAVVQAAPRRRF